jgi:ABC-type dipeptide/oligopeptide/nickel transport system ATPase component
MLFVTHDIGLARKIGDRIGVMLGGRIVEMGPAERIFNRPGPLYGHAHRQRQSGTRSLLRNPSDIEKRRKGLSICSSLRSRFDHLSRRSVAGG